MAQIEVDEYGPAVTAVRTSALGTLPDARPPNDGHSLPHLSREASAADAPVTTVPATINSSSPTQSYNAEVGAQPPEQPPAPLAKIDLYPPRDPATYTDFDRKYPPDRHGDEAGPNARVWRVYRDRVTELDEDLMQGWNSTLDVLLIFAGLFSAIVTAFVIEATTQLQHDYTQYTAIGVFAVLAALNGTVAAPSSLPDFNHVQVASRSRWINGIWFASLALALIDALLAILVKQWLVEYGSRARQPAVDGRQWARRHAAFREGLSKWGIGFFISSLAVILHMALFLFLFGLLAYLFDLDSTICAFGTALTAGTGLFYVAATLAPLWFGDCPSVTPLLPHIRATVMRVSSAWFHIWHRTARLLYTTSVKGKRTNDEDSDDENEYEDDNGGKKHAKSSSPSQRNVNPLPAYHLDSVVTGKESLRDAQILSWMIEHLPTDADVSVAVDAIGSQDVFAHEKEFPNVRQDDNPLSQEHVEHATKRRLRSLLLVMDGYGGTDSEKASLALALRSWMFIRSSIEQSTWWEMKYLEDVRLFDLHLLWYMLTERFWSKANGQAPDSKWLQLDALKLMRDWRATWGVNAPEPLQPIHSVTMDLLLSDITCGSKAITALDGELLSCSAAATIAPASQWTTRRLKILAQIVRRDLSARFKNTPESSKLSDARRLRDEWERICCGMDDDPWYVSAMMIWGFAIEHAVELSATAEVIEWLASGYNLFIEYAGSDEPQEAPSLPQVERCLRCFSSSTVVGWNGNLISAAAAARLLGKVNGSPSYWSRQLGEITFSIVRQLQQSKDLAQNIEHLVKLTDFATTSSFRYRLKRYRTLDHHISETCMNLLLLHPLDATSGMATSTWAIITTSATVDRVSAEMRRLARALAFLVHVTAAESIQWSSEPSPAQAFHELAAKDYGVKLAMHDTECFADFARHGRLLSGEWWQYAKTHLLALSDDEWNMREGPQEAHLTPHALVDEIEAAGSCCADCEYHLPRITAVRRAKFSTTSHVRMPVVGKDVLGSEQELYTQTSQPGGLVKRIAERPAKVVRWMRGGPSQQTESETAEMQSLHKTGSAV